MNIEIYGTPADLRAAVAVAKEGAASKAEHVTVMLASNLLDMIDTGGEWTMDVRGAWVEIEEVEPGELQRLYELVEAYGG